MEGFASLLGLAALVAAWWLIAKKLKGKNWFLRHLAGSTAGVVALVVVMTFFVATGLVDPEDDISPTVADAQESTATINNVDQIVPGANPSVNADALVAPKPASQTEPEKTIADAVATAGYSVASDEYHAAIKRSVEVILDSQITEAELTSIAEEIKAQATHATERTFIGYRLGSQTEGVYWATTHYNPELDVRIIGMTAAEAEEAKDTPITRFANVSEMIEDFGDYSESNGTYRLVSSEPLHIHLSPAVFKGDSETAVRSELKRSVIYGIYKTLAHTDAAHVRVSSTPIITSLRPISHTPVESPRKELSLSRSDALEALQAYIDVQDIFDVIAITKIGDFTLHTWSPEFENLYLEDRTPGRKAFFDELGKKAIQ